jgi:glycosyltransferase involved in cell wall biosynthesis
VRKAVFEGFMNTTTKSLLKLAIVGTRGLPPQYSGFETLVEYLTQYLSAKIDITVFCSKEQRPKLKEYNNARLVYLPFSANNWQSIIYDSLSIMIAYRKFDKILILGCSNLVMSLMGKYRNKFLLNIGGIEWQRAKWGRFASKIIKYSEKISVNNSMCLIADNEGIKEYLFKTYNKESLVIEYGGDQVKKISLNPINILKYPFLKDNYILNVARIQPDNNIEMIIKAFENIQSYKLAIIGNWSFSKYGIKLKDKYRDQNNIILLDAIYNQEELNVIRSNAKLYLHGHSAGGTNPSLVEAMSLGLPIFCFDNKYNRYTTENKAEYFKTADQLHSMLGYLNSQQLQHLSIVMKEISLKRYRWEVIANKYYEAIVNNTSQQSV